MAASRYREGQKQRVRGRWLKRERIGDRGLEKEGQRQRFRNSGLGKEDQKKKVSERELERGLERKGQREMTRQ